VDWVGEEKEKDGGLVARLWLNENKTKSQIDSDKINRQLTFDLQTMTYLVAIPQSNVVDEKLSHDWRMVGVRYNIVRRSAHKSVESMMKKLTEDYHNGRIGEWFARWDVPVHQTDYEVFKTQCLNPILENLLDDYEWWHYASVNQEMSDAAGLVRSSVYEYDLRQRFFPKHLNRHFRMPYGIYNPVAEGGFGDLDEYMRTGSEVGLERVVNLFSELEG
jgi:hypothetical protein